MKEIKIGNYADERGDEAGYSSSYCQLMINYFREALHKTDVDRVKKRSVDEDGIERYEYESVANDLPLFETFAQKINATVSMLESWRKEHADFALAYERCKDMQRACFVNRGLKCGYNPAFGKLVAINVLGWRDSSRVDPQQIKKDAEALSNADINKELDKRIKSIPNVAQFKKTADE